MQSNTTHGDKVVQSTIHTPLNSTYSVLEQNKSYITHYRCLTTCKTCEKLTLNLDIELSEMKDMKDISERWRAVCVWPGWGGAQISVSWTR